MDDNSFSCKFFFVTIPKHQVIVFQLLSSALKIASLATCSSLSTSRSLCRRRLPWTSRSAVSRKGENAYFSRNIHCQPIFSKCLKHLQLAGFWWSTMFDTHVMDCCWLLTKSTWDCLKIQYCRHEFTSPQITLLLCRFTTVQVFGLDWWSIYSWCIHLCIHC